MYLLFAFVAGILALLAGACSYVPRPSSEPRMLSKLPNAKTGSSFLYQVLCWISSVAASWAGLIFLLRWLYPSGKVIFLHRIGVAFQDPSSQTIAFPTVLLGCLFIPLVVGWTLGWMAMRSPQVTQATENAHSSALAP